MSAEPISWISPSTAVAELEKTVRNLEAALQTARVIGQAQGLLMAESRCTAEEAFDELVKMSQHLNVKLHQVAAGLVLVATRPQPHRVKKTPPVAPLNRQRPTTVLPRRVGTCA